jgi:L-rhamnose isomerase
MALTKFLVAKQYAETVQQAQLVDQELTKAFKLLDQDNEVNYYGPVHKAYDHLVEQLLGPELFEHTLNWIYEHDLGNNIDLDFSEYFDSHQDSHKNLKHD